MAKNLTKKEIKLARAALKMTRLEVAQRIGISYETMKYIEQGYYAGGPYTMKDDVEAKLRKLFKSRGIRFLARDGLLGYGLEMLNLKSKRPMPKSSGISGAAVRTARSAIPISQKNLAPFIGVHPETVKYLELGRHVGQPCGPNSVLSDRLTEFFISKGVEILLPDRMREFGIWVRK